MDWNILGRSPDRRIQKTRFVKVGHAALELVLACSSAHILACLRNDEVTFHEEAVVVLGPWAVQPILLSGAFFAGSCRCGAF